MSAFLKVKFLQNAVGVGVYGFVLDINKKVKCQFDVFWGFLASVAYGYL